MHDILAKFYEQQASERRANEQIEKAIHRTRLAERQRRDEIELGKESDDDSSI